jgi:hypothetical protein
MSKAKKALIIIGAILFIPAIAGIAWVYGVAAFKTQMKNGGHIDPKRYKYVFSANELIDHFMYNEIPVYVVTDAAIDRLYHTTGTCYMPGIGVMVNPFIWNLKDTEDDLYYRFVLAHECGHAVDRKENGDDGFFSTPALDQDLDTVIEHEAKADAYAILATNVSDDEYIKIRNWINYEYSEIGRTALENNDQEMLSKLEETYRAQMNAALELLRKY